MIFKWSAVEDNFFNILLFGNFSNLLTKFSSRSFIFLCKFSIAKFFCKSCCSSKSYSCFIIDELHLDMVIAFNDA